MRMTQHRNFFDLGLMVISARTCARAAPPQKNFQNDNVIGIDKFQVSPMFTAISLN